MTNYVYRADGTKVKKLFGDIETNYLDGFQYKSTKPPEANSGGGLVVIDANEVAVMKLRIIPTSEGYFDVLTNQYIYNYTDHLGNVRLSYSDTNKDGIIQPRQYLVSQCSGNWNPPFEFPTCIDNWKPGEIVEVNNYYPFGLMHNYTVTTQNAYQYKYNGKELQETGMYDYGARFYMPDIGRWGVVDPMAEDMRRHSPYNYAFNNPINFVDPDGNAPYNPRDFYGKNSAFNDDFDPNTTIYGNGSFGGYKYYEMGVMYDGSGRNAGGYNFTGNAAGSMYNYFVNGGSIDGISFKNGWAQWWTDGDESYQRIMNGEMEIGDREMIMHRARLTGNDYYMDYWGLLNNASTAQSYATNGIGATLGNAARVSNNLVDAGKMIKTPNIFKTYNLYRSNGYLNGNKYISGTKFLKNVKTINALNNSKVVKGIGYAGLVISGEQFRVTHHPGYISRGISSFGAGFIPYVGPAISIGIDNTNVNYWNIWTWGDPE